MALSVTEDNQERLVLGVSLAEIARVPPWIERLALRYGIPASVQFACNLCLEESLSNIILHGYRGRNEGALGVGFAVPRDGWFLFVVEDETPHFNPLEQPELPALNPNEEMRVGGQGLRFLRKFADLLEYEPLPSGNRLKIYFSTDRVPGPDNDSDR